MTDVRTHLQRGLATRIQQVSPRIQELDEFRLLQMHHTLDLIFRLPGDEPAVSTVNPAIENCERCGGRRIKGTDTR